MSCRAVIGRHRDRGLPSASAWFVPVHVCRYRGLPSPCQSAPGSLSVGFIDRRLRPRITAGYIYGKRSAHLCAIAAWRVDSFAFFSVHMAWFALSQVKAILRARPGNTIPSISPMCAQARRRFTQVIHMVVHSKACNTFSSRAGRQQGVSMPVSARGGRHAGRGSGLGLDAIAHDGGHRMLAAHPAGHAARVPSRGTREPRPCSAGSQIIAARIPAVAGVPGLARRFLPGRIRQGSSMYEMEGPCLRRRAKPTS